MLALARQNAITLGVFARAQALNALNSRRLGNRLLWSLVFLLLFVQFRLLFVRVYDPDEFEHVHAGFAWASGSLPYRDFFEHHGPVTYLLSALMIRFLPASLDLLVAHRACSFVLLFLTLAGVARVARQLYGPRSVAPALLALLSYSVFIEKSVEWRPDVMAQALLVWSLALLLDRSRLVSGFCGGALGALACLTTIKSIFLFAAIASSAFRTMPTRLPSKWAYAGAVGAGAIGAVGIVAGLLAWVGNFVEALHALVEVPAQWPIRTAGPSILWSMPAWAPGHQVLFVWGWVSLLADGRRQTSRRKCRWILGYAVAAHTVGWFLAPVVYFQYYLLAFPIAAVIGAGEFLRHFRLASRWRSSAVWLGIGLIGAVVWFLACLIVPWVSLRSPFPVVWIVASLLGLGGGTLLVGLIARSGFMRRMGFASLLLGLAAPSLLQVAVMHFYWLNAKQKRDVALVEHLVPPGESVMDGFTGLGFRRPHASYWWWINEHTLPMLLSAGADESLRGQVAEGRPGLVIVDEHLMKLPGLSQVMPRHYVLLNEHLSCPYPFFLRKDLFDRWREENGR